MIVGVIVPVIIITFVNISLRPSLMLSKNLLYPCHIQRLSFTSHYLNCPLFCDLNWLLLTNQKLIKSETHQIRNSPNQKLTKLETHQTGTSPNWKTTGLDTHLSSMPFPTSFLHHLSLIHHSIKSWNFVLKSASAVICFKYICPIWLVFPPLEQILHIYSYIWSKVHLVNITT